MRTALSLIVTDVACSSVSRLLKESLAVLPIENDFRVPVAGAELVSVAVAPAVLMVTSSFAFGTPVGFQLLSTDQPPAPPPDHALVSPRPPARHQPQPKQTCHYRQHLSFSRYRVVCHSSPSTFLVAQLNSNSK